MEDGETEIQGDRLTVPGSPLQPVPHPSDSKSEPLRLSVPHGFEVQSKGDV